MKGLFWENRMNRLKCNCSMAASNVRAYFIETSLCDCILHVSALELLVSRGREVLLFKFNR